MPSLSILSPAKINWSLDVGALRPDGFHEIDSVFALLKFGDTLELEKGGPEELKRRGYEIYSQNGLSLAVSFSAAYPAICRRDILSGLKNNSIFQAVKLLRREIPVKNPSPMRLILHKSIPTGAGLGGGSSNAAAALKLWVRYFKLKVPPARLQNWGASLGSDVPFFLKANPGRALWRSCGRGEKLKLIRKPWKRHILIVYPGFAVGTAWAYRELDRTRGVKLTARIILPRLKSTAFPIRPRNSFEPVVFKSHPVLAEAKRFLEQREAERVSLTGSGSCLFATARRADLCREWVHAMRLSKRFAGFHYYATEIDN